MLIVDMPIPKNCIFCPMSHWNKLDEWTGCDAVCGKRFAATTDKEYRDMEGRPDWCPIKGELVRCGECKHFEREEYYCSRLGVNCDDTWFCADGERKDGEHEAAI